MSLLVVFFVDRFTAISEKTIKIMLIPFQEKDKKSFWLNRLAKDIYTKGVIKQCIKQRELERIPKLSEFLNTILI